MKIAISGSSGMIGSHLLKTLPQQGHQVCRIVRFKTQESDAGDMDWDILKETLDLKSQEGIDVVIHLGGVNVADHRWTSQYKQLIFDSRVKGTHSLVKAILKLKNRPKVFLSASAVGYYGNHPSDVTLDEDSKRGEGFLARVCYEWEGATNLLFGLGIRVIFLRFGMVLGKEKGALGKMLPIFRLGLGGPIADGTQVISWLSLKEIPLIIHHLLLHDSLHGAVNMVSSNPVTNLKFTKILGAVIHRPTIFPVPKLAIKILFGEMGESLLWGGAKVFPKRLLNSGYQFKYADLKLTLEDILRS